MFPNRLREWRNARGLSLQKLADLTNQKHQSVARHETGANQMTLDQVETYARALQIKPEEILKGSLRISDRLRELVDLLDNLPTTEQERVVGMVRAFAEPRPVYDSAEPAQKIQKRR